MLMAIRKEYLNDKHKQQKTHNYEPRRLDAIRFGTIHRAIVEPLSNIDCTYIKHLPTLYRIICRTSYRLSIDSLFDR